MRYPGQHAIEMKNIKGLFPLLLPVVLFLGSCATMQPTAEVRDDVYFLPPYGPELASVGAAVPMDEPEPVVDDYYDPGTAESYSSDRNFYDLTYNDPYYYNYDRFGFGTSLGYNTGYGWGPNGMMIGLGYGSGVYSGWTYGISGGSAFPYGNIRWNATYGYYNCFGGPSPWCNPCNGWGGGYGYGYGYGSYYGPYGNCLSCYSPVIIGGGSNVVVGHRPSMGAGGGSRTDPGASRLTARDPVRLNPTGSHPGRLVGTRPTSRTGGLQPAREVRTIDTQRRGTVTPNNGGSRTRESRPAERSTPRMGGGGEIRSTSPSRSTGGGNTGGGGGGVRTSPNRR